MLNLRGERNLTPHFFFLCVGGGAIRKHSISTAPQESWVEDHTVEETNLWCSKGFWFVILPAPRKIHGRSAEDPAEVMDVKPHLPTGLLLQATCRPARKIRGRLHGSHLVPPASFQAAGPGATVFRCCGFQVARQHVAGHRVATNAKKLSFACTTEDARKIYGRPPCKS